MERREGSKEREDGKRWLGDGRKQKEAVREREDWSDS